VIFLEVNNSRQLINIIYWMFWETFKGIFMTRGILQKQTVPPSTLGIFKCSNLTALDK
jgi:hypothetical protein